MNFLRLLSLPAWRDILARAAKTALQAFLGVATVSVLMSGDVALLESAAYAGAAAGLAVIHNAILQWVRS